MWEMLSNRTVDIYIGLMTGLATGIPCTLLGLLLDHWIKGRQPEAVPHGGPAQYGLTITQALQIRVEVRAMTVGATGGDRALWTVVIAIMCIAYLFLRQQTLVVAMVLTFCLVGLWTGVALHSLYRGYLRGASWLVYMVGMLAFAAGVFLVLLAAQSPENAPPYFAQWQQYAEAYGVDGLRRSGMLNFQSAGWLVIHVLGVAAMFLAIRDAALSMYFYAAASGKASQDSVSGLPGWAARHALNPVLGLIRLAVTLLFAYYLVDGIAFVFVTQRFPVLEQELLNYIFHGTRGLQG